MLFGLDLCEALSRGDVCVRDIAVVALCVTRERFPNRLSALNGEFLTIAS